MTDTRKYFDAKIFGPGGLVPSPTRRFHDADEIWTLEISHGRKWSEMLWREPVRDVITTCHPDDAANSCRIAAEDWLIANESVLRLMGTNDRASAARCVRVDRHDGTHQYFDDDESIHDALIAAIKSLKGAK